MNTYLYTGKDLYRMEQSLHELLKNHEVDREHTITFDGSDHKNFRIESAFMECDTVSLFDEEYPKAVIVKNPYFLTHSDKETKAKKSTTKKAKKENAGDDLVALLDAFLKADHGNTLFILYCDSFDADSRKKEYKLLQKHNVKIIQFLPMKDREFAVYMDEQLKKNHFHLNQEAREELSLRVDIDTMKLHNAIEKMLLYGEKELNGEDIRHIVPANSTLNAFRLSSMFIKGDLEATMKAKDEMLMFNYDYNAMIMMLAGRIRSLYNMKHLYEQGLNTDDIAVRLHANPWAVKFGMQDCMNLQADVLLSYLDQLADLDQGIKAGTIEPKDGFENFLLRNGKRM